jgi:transposase
MVRKWVRQFNEGREDVHDEARSGRPSVVNDELVHAVDSKVHEDRRFTSSSLSLHFPQISRTILYETVRSFELSEVVLTLGAKDAL